MVPCAGHYRYVLPFVRCIQQWDVGLPSGTRSVYIFYAHSFQYNHSMLFHSIVFAISMFEKHNQTGRQIIVAAVRFVPAPTGV